MYILKCEAFDDEKSARYTNACCKGDCHEGGNLINVTPYAIDATLENKRLDWELGIQGMVCCGRYEFVRSLSREWWIEAGRRVGLWDESKCRALMHKGSWHGSFDNTGRSESNYSGNLGVSSTAHKKVATGKGKCPSCGAKWTGDVCENCGHGLGI